MSQLEATTNTTNNIFLQNSSKILCMVMFCKHSSNIDDVAKIKEFFKEKLSLYKSKLEEQKIQREYIIGSQYCLCAFIDEIMLSSKVHGQHQWSKTTLLSNFFQETFGGVNFYTILEKMLLEPKQNLEIIEFLYILLLLNFQGKYHNTPEDRRKIINRICSILNSYRSAISKIPKNISWEQNINKATKKTYSIFLALFMSLILSVVSFSLLELNLFRQAKPLLNIMSINDRLLDEFY